MELPCKGGRKSAFMGKLRVKLNFGFADPKNNDLANMR